MIRSLRHSVESLHEDAQSLYRACGDRRLPLLQRGLAGVVALYVLSPLRVALDVVPLVGVAEELFAILLLRASRRLGRTHRNGEPIDGFPTAVSVVVTLLVWLGVLTAIVVGAAVLWPAS